MTRVELTYIRVLCNARCNMTVGLSLRNDEGYARYFCVGIRKGPFCARDKAAYDVANEPRIIRPPFVSVSTEGGEKPALCVPLSKLTGICV